MENDKTYQYYNRMMDELEVRCKAYLKMLEGCDLEEMGGTTRLDVHRFNVCQQTVEDILKMMRINGRLRDNNYVRIAMVHARRYLFSLEEIIEDVIYFMKNQKLLWR